VLGVNDDIEPLLAAATAGVADLSRRAHALVLDVFPAAVVTVDNENIGYGTTTGYKGLVFVVAPHQRHVSLGVYGGADLPDPAGLLEGTGKVHRHVKIRSAADLERPELRELMTTALARRG
jgi:hypothetical protein